MRASCCPRSPNSWTNPSKAFRGALLRGTLRDSGRTAVLVTHTALDALVLADRVVVLSDGVVAEEGATREVLARPRSPFAARIAGLDLVPGLACPEGLKTADGSVITGHAEGKSSKLHSVVRILGARPQAPRSAVGRIRTGWLTPTDLAHGE